MAAHTIAIDGETAQIATAAELVVALDVLQGNRDREVLEQLRPHLAKIITDARGLHDTLKVLSTEDSLLLIDAIGPAITDVIGRAPALRDLLASIAETEIEEALLRAIGPDGLRSLIGSPDDLAGVLEWVYGQCDELALDLLGAEFLRSLLRTGAELALVLRSLDRARQEDLIEMIGWERVPALVMDERDLAHLMRALSGGLSCELLDLIPDDRLHELVRDERDWAELEPFLDSSEWDYLRARVPGVPEVGSDAE